MKTYLMSLLGAALLSILVSHLSPEGERGGIAKHVHLLSSLLLICVLLAPVQRLIDTLPSLLEGEWLTQTENARDDTIYREQLQEAIKKSSADYFTDMLAKTLCDEFSISQEELWCRVLWDPTASELTPTGVTVVLSGRAVWQDPAKIRATVEALVKCPCDVVIE